ncbi:dihydrolipoamide acetyltransferase family protein [Mucilaginibacter calamicampi]|uniref:Dihydrolipoamide acetyltransferase component of pyruvate dehydrogenase complex n=1 Tax=Mucilaginibacter calamicampi TaxID=1302352 RepID=A0ABW2YW70_9SPHI
MARYELLLPKMGESVAEATIIKWVKNPGDYIEADDAVIDIATDKVDSEVPSPVSGTLVEQLCKADDVVQVGAVVAIIETDEPKEEETPAPVESEPQSKSGSAKKKSAPQPEQEITEPVATEQTEQSIPGTDLLEQAQTLLPQRSPNEPQRFYSPLVKHIAFQEKVGVEELDRIPGSGSDGRLTKDDLLNYLRIRDKDKVAADAPPTSPAGYEIGVDVTPVVELPKVVEPEPEPEPEPQPEPEPESEPAVAAKPEVKPVAETAQSKKEESAVNTEEEEPLMEAQAPAASFSGTDEIIEMDRMRRLIAEHMVMSKHTSPHVTSFVEADVTNLVMWRDKIKNTFEKREGEKITFTPIFIEAVVKAIKDFPLINSSVNGTQIIRKAAINISMATALPNGNLIVPVIRKADELNLLGLTKAVNNLATKARNNKLQPDDVKEGTFTITNVGTFGNLMGTPIINQPQVAILALGAIKKKPAVLETHEGDFVVVRHMMFLSLSYDHRVVDGALGGSFVKRVADYLENWDINRGI